MSLMEGRDYWHGIRGTGDRYSSKVLPMSPYTCNSCLQYKPRQERVSAHRTGRGDNWPSSGWTVYMTWCMPPPICSIIRGKDSNLTSIRWRQLCQTHRFLYSPLKEVCLTAPFDSSPLIWSLQRL